MRIYFVTYSLAGGGMEKNMLLLISRLMRSGYRCTLFLIEGTIDYKQTVHQLKGVGLHTVVGLPNAHDSFLLKLFAVGNLIRHIYRHSKKMKPDYLVGTEPVSWTVCLLCRVLFRFPYIVQVCLPVDRIRYYYAVLLFPHFYFATHIVSKSIGLADYVKKMFHIEDKKLSTIYNGVENSASVSPPPKSADITFVTIGRLEKQKNHLYLLRAFKLVHGMKPNVRLIIIGKGTQRDALESEVDRMGLKDVVMFTGFVLRPLDYLSSASCFVLSSDFEGFGTVLIEAMQRGTPVISTDCPYGPREILTGSEKYTKYTRTIKYGKYGVLVPTFENTKTNETLLAKAMLRVGCISSVNNHYRKQAKKGARFYSLEATVKQYIGLFNRLA